MILPQAEPSHIRRLVAVVVLLGLLILGLILRLLDLSVIKQHFLQNQWSQRAIREIIIPANRGMITDRNGEPLAISTPVYAAWIDPQKTTLSHTDIIALSKILAVNSTDVEDNLNKIKNLKNKRFIYLKRNISPPVASAIQDLNIKGLFLERQYKRYYPAGEACSQLIGFTNIDDIGQEGLELQYNDWLAGKPGLKKIIQDRYGNEVDNLGILRQPTPGHDLVLSIDNKLQYLAYKELSNGIEEFGAKSGSIIILDTKTGEILAMANAPSFNPNARPTGNNNMGLYRNRAVTDLFEPGSTLKTIAMATALSSGKYKPTSTVNTNPGYWFIDNKKIDDDGVNEGIITFTRVLQVSSNVGISKIILSMAPSAFLNLIQNFGFIQPSGINFPGESNGMIASNANHSQFVLATIAFGYGISVNLLQLAHAYQAIANNGQMAPLSLMKLNAAPTADQYQQVLAPEVASDLRIMLEKVLDRGGGTAVQARVPNYLISGKTGTTRILGPHGYEKDHHNSAFVGMAPASNPRLIVAVILHDPSKKAYLGGFVAGPVFSKVMGDALRILNVPPDNTAT